jgi:hypothetical protein
VRIPSRHESKLIEQHIHFLWNMNRIEFSTEVNRADDTLFDLNQAKALARNPFGQPLRGPADMITAPVTGGGTATTGITSISSSDYYWSNGWCGGKEGKGSKDYISMYRISWRSDVSLNNLCLSGSGVGASKIFVEEFWTKFTWNSRNGFKPECVRWISSKYFVVKFQVKFQVENSESLSSPLLTQACGAHSLRRPVEHKF